MWFTLSYDGDDSAELFHPGSLGDVPGACVKLESDCLGCVVLLELC